MTCFHPNLMKCKVDSAIGSLIYTFEGPAKSYNPADFGSIDDLTTKGYYYLTVPCGHCIGCNIDYSRQWANRMILELKESSHGAIFLTLTYNDIHLPHSEFGDSELRKSDLQDFWKRLRYYFPDRRIRYFVAGEYGPKTLRPHYHAIVYGLNLEDFPDRYVQRYNNIHQPLYDSPKLRDIWGNGFVLFSDVTWHTCAYVSRYVLKKHYGSSLDDLESRQPEFNLSSRRPGIGLSDYENYILSDCTHFPIDGKDGIYTIPIPKAFIKKAKRDGLEVDKVNSLCYNRSKEAHERLISDLMFSEQTYQDYLESHESELLAKIKTLEERK